MKSIPLASGGIERNHRFLGSSSNSDNATLSVDNSDGSGGGGGGSSGVDGIDTLFLRPAVYQSPTPFNPAQTVRSS